MQYHPKIPGRLADGYVEYMQQHHGVKVIQPTLIAQGVRIACHGEKRAHKVLFVPSAVQPMR